MKDLSEETTWEKAAEPRMGKYLTRIETAVVADSITGLRLQMIMDVGGDAGKFSLLEEKNYGTVLSIDIDVYGSKRLKLQNIEVNVISSKCEKYPIEKRNIRSDFHG